MANEQHPDMNAPLTRGEMEQALQPLREGIAANTNAIAALAAAISHLTDEMGAMESRWESRLINEMGALESRLESQLKQHVNAAVEQIRTFILGLDDKYKELPARVSKLEQLPGQVQRLEDKVFAPKRKRR